MTSPLLRQARRERAGRRDYSQCWHEGEQGHEDSQEMMVRTVCIVRAMSVQLAVYCTQDVDMEMHNCCCVLVDAKLHFMYTVYQNAWAVHVKLGSQ